MSKEQYTVSWVMGGNDKIIKFKEPDETFDIAEDVFKYLESKELITKLEDTKVEVEIDKAQGQNGTVTFLKLLDNNQTVEPKEETKTTSNDTADSATNLIVKEMTVGGVSVEKAGVIFKDEEKVWYTLDSTINAQKFKDECTKKVVQVTIAPQEKGNDVIKSYILKEEDKKDNPEKEPETSSSNGKDAFYRIKQLENQVRYLKEEKAESFEAQASVNSANQTVSGMVTPDSKPDFVLKLIERIAKHNFAIMRELKKKE